MMKFLHKTLLCTGLLAISALQAVKDKIIIKNKHHDAVIIKAFDPVVGGSKNQGITKLEEDEKAVFAVPMGTASLELYYQYRDNGDKEQYLCSFIQPGNYVIDYPYNMLWIEHAAFTKKNLQAPILDIFCNKRRIGNVYTKNTQNGVVELLLQRASGSGIVYCPRKEQKKTYEQDNGCLEIIKNSRKNMRYEQLKKKAF